jgi:hypothetical protein
MLLSAGVFKKQRINVVQFGGDSWLLPYASTAAKGPLG